MKRAREELHRMLLRSLHKDDAAQSYRGQAIKRLLVPMGQLIIRFSQYCGYPSRVVTMSRRFNPDGYHDEVMPFLHADAISFLFGHGFFIPAPAGCLELLLSCLRPMLFSTC